MVHYSQHCVIYEIEQRNFYLPTINGVGPRSIKVWAFLWPLQISLARTATVWKFSLSVHFLFFFSWQLQYLCFFSSFQWGPHQSHIQLVTISTTPTTKLLFPACFVIGPSENFFTFHTWYIVVRAVGSESKNLSYLKSCGYFQIIICSSRLYFPFLKSGCFDSYQSEGGEKNLFLLMQEERERQVFVGWSWFICLRAKYLNFF